MDVGHIVDSSQQLSSSKDTVKKRKNISDNKVVINDKDIWKKNQKELIKDGNKTKHNPDKGNKKKKKKEYNFTNKETFYYNTINKFFKKKCSKDEIERMIHIINKESKISLRKLDWFITKYAQKYRTETTYTVNGEQFPVHISYKAQLSTYRKKYFDPFRRRRKFDYYYDKDDDTRCINTTLGQLNFFVWAISNKIIDFVEEHYDDLSNVMVDTNKQTKKHKKQKTKKITKVKNDDVTVVIEEHKKDNLVDIVLSFD